MGRYFEEGDAAGLPINIRRIYALFAEVFINYPENLDDVVYIINNYINIIENSTDYNDAEREIICAGFVTAAASPHFWLKRMVVEMDV